MQFYGGQIHLIAGENGAGKSTLLRLLYGVYPPSSGQILLNGKAIVLDKPRTARRNGIGLVFQQFSLISAMDVLQNVALYASDSALLHYGQLRRVLVALCQRYGFDIDLDTRVGDLSVADQQKVELLKLCVSDNKVLMLDEPTSALSQVEADAFMAFVKAERDIGKAIIFTSHRIIAALEVADRVTVLRKGSVIGSWRTSELPAEHVTKLIFGSARSVNAAIDKPATRKHLTTPVIELRSISTAPRAGKPRLADLSLRLFPGEIVGVIGSGQGGQFEVGEVMIGEIKPACGERFLYGRRITNWSTGMTLRHGVAVIPANLLSDAVVASLTVKENVILRTSNRYAMWSGLRINWDRVESSISAAHERIRLILADLNAFVWTLSGGNVQRLVIARELMESPRVLIAIDPSRGLDIAGVATTSNLLAMARDESTAVLLISYSNDELLKVCDRIINMRAGRIVSQGLDSLMPTRMPDRT